MNKGDLDVIGEAINKINADLREQDLREKARRAKLSPTQRQAEDDEKARRRQIEEARKLEAKIQKAARPYRGHESMPLRVYAALLHGVDPASLDWNWFPPAELQTTIDKLNSCVGGSLRPWNPGAAADKLMFATRELIAVARRKRLPNVEIVARALDAEPPAQATVGAIQTATSKSAESAKTDSASEFKHQRLVQAAIEGLIREARELAGNHKIDPKALPFEHSDICERYRALCAASDIEQLSGSSVRQLVNKCGYKLASGNRGGWQLELLRKLRSKKKPTS